MKGTKALTMASMVAAMFGGVACGPGTTGTPDTGKDQQAVVKCEGINTCAGTSACAGAPLPDGGMSDCAGHNTCAGQGWIEVSRAECSSKGGKEKK